MAKYSKQHNISEQTNEEALKITRATQKSGQTKEQTKLIAQGIKKGIEQYKKQQSEKARELDKKLRKVKAGGDLSRSSTDNETVHPVVVRSKLPWILLVVSWLGFAVYLFQST